MERVLLGVTTGIRIEDRAALCGRMAFAGSAHLARVCRQSHHAMGRPGPVFPLV